MGEFLFGAFYTAELDRRLEEAFYDPTQLTWERVEAVRADMSRPESKAAALSVARDLELQSAYDVPHETLVVWGEQDAVAPIHFGERLAEDLPNARLERIDRCGHYPMLEHPGLFDDVLRAFLD